MLQKILPTHGKVLIVDNEYDDVVKLIDLFAEMGVPYIYYDYEKLKENKICKCAGIRLLFLDIRLEDGIQGSKNIYTTLASTVEQIVKPNNGPYIIILWTNEISLKDEVEKYLKSNLDISETTIPTYICGMDKKEFMGNPQNILKDGLERELEPQYMINFLLGWEKVAMNTSSNLVELLSYGLNSCIDNSAIENILIQIACLENSKLATKDEATSNVLGVFSELLNDKYLELVSNPNVIDELKEYWQYDFSNVEKTAEMRMSIPIEQRAIINTLLNINTYGKKEEQMPGKVFILKNSDLKFDVSDFNDSCFNKWFLNNEIDICGEKVHFSLKPIEIDITPHCDYAQNKNYMLRTVFGYLIELDKIKIDKGEEIWHNAMYSKKIKGKAAFEYIYVSPEIMIDNKICILLINTQYMTLEKKTFYHNYTYSVRINGDMLNEIRKKCSETISRIGINNI